MIIDAIITLGLGLGIAVIVPLLLIICANNKRG